MHMSEIANINHFEQAQPVSEKFADAIRADRLEEIDHISEYAACVIPLLTALGWRAYQRDLLEALPHFVDHIDLVDLRNLLVALGYESDARRVVLNKLHEDLLPCLFVGDEGDVWVITDVEEDSYLIYDASQRKMRKQRLAAGKGTAYFFTDTNPSHVIPASSSTTESWFFDTVSHFRGLIKHLVGMTFMLNLIALAVPLFIMVVYDNVIGANTLTNLPYLVIGLAVALAVELLMRVLRSRTIGIFSGRIDYIIGVEAIKRLLYLPPYMTERASVAAQLSRLRQFDSIRDFFTGSSATLFLELPFVVFFIAVLAFLAGEVAYVPVVMVFVYFLFAIILFPSLNRELKYAGNARTARQRMLMDTFLGLRELKSLGAEQSWKEIFREVSGQAMTSSYKTSSKYAVVNSISQSLMSIAGISVLTIGTFKVMQGEISIGVLIAVMALLWRVLSPLQGICLSVLQIEQVVQSVRQLNQLMKIEPERVGGKSGLLVPSIQGHITFDRVSFRYNAGADPSLLGASFTIKAGEFVTILGANGSGKSTILKLIAGMYRPQSGGLLIDSTDVRQFNAVDLRRLVAYVPQRPTLFYGTIAQNLRLTCPMATDVELECSARQAGIYDAIQALPRGFDTLVGDSSTQRLSNSLIHGICLARAYIRRAPILLMDEPSESLDMVTSQKLVKQLTKLKGKQTIIMVSHQAGHIRLSDRSIVLRDGSVIHTGSPEECLAVAQGGQYER